MTTASSFVKHCPRCFRSINIGHAIENIGVIDGRKRWAHVGCKGAVQIDQNFATRSAEAMKAGLKKTVQVTKENDDYHQLEEFDKSHEDVSADLADVKAMVKATVADFALTLKEELKEDHAKAISRMADRLEDNLTEFVKRMVVEQISERAPVEVRHVFQMPEGIKAEFKDEVFHPNFDRIVRLAMAGKPIFLPGPTGCGKTHTAMQLAKVIHGEEWESHFGMISCSPGLTEGQILGKSVPNIATGEEVYRRSEFVRIYEEGGVFLFDEMDAADPSVLLILNAGLANGRIPIPNRPDNPVAIRHPKFVCVAAANTWGTGSDRQYVGRNPLDEATLDRFRIGTVACDYSPAIERAICPDVPLYRLLKGWREKMRAAGVKRIISTRFFKDACDMLAMGDGIEDIENSLFGGWKPDEVVKVLGRTLNEPRS
jgi:DNA polymerase III delta prime subunit